MTGGNPSPRRPMVIPDHRISIGAVQRAVAAEFGLSPSAMTVKHRRHDWSRPRQLAMLLARELTRASWPVIGRQFGGRDPSTVIYGAAQASARIRREAQTQAIAERVAARLREAAP